MYKFGASLIMIALGLGANLLLNKHELFFYICIGIIWLLLSHLIFYTLRVCSLPSTIQCTCKAPYTHNNFSKIKIELSKAQSFIKLFSERTRTKADMTHLLLKAIPTALSNTDYRLKESISIHKSHDISNLSDTVSLLLNIRNNSDQLITLKSINLREFENIVRECNLKETEIIKNLQNPYSQKNWQRVISVSFLKNWLRNLYYTISTLFWCDCGRLVQVSEISSNMPGTAIVMSLESFPISHVRPSLPIFNFVPLVILLGNKLKIKQKKVDSEMVVCSYINIYASSDCRIFNIWELTDILTNLRTLISNPRSYLTKISY